MIKLSQLLNESDNVAGGPRTKQIASAAAGQKLLIHKASAALEAARRDCGIYRGVKTLPNEYAAYRFVRPAKAYRMAKNTTNFTNAVLDVIPSWKSWPKRSQSIVCSNAPDRAGGYGITFGVFPFNGAKIGISSDADFWMSFERLNDRLGWDVATFNDQMAIALEGIGIYEDLERILPRGIQKIFNHIDSKFILYPNFFENLFASSSYRSRDPILKDMAKYMTEGAEKYFDELLNPEANGFKLVTIEEYDLSQYPAMEVWTDSPALLIDRKVVALP